MNKIIDRSLPNDVVGGLSFVKNNKNIVSSKNMVKAQIIHHTDGMRPS